ncbi:hypothetical protein, partial [Lysinibacillus capsici]|uniref:hypothetical protein n=1 Tax=Lysinibacillus capsici TaxID=2115968 RepID=UPI002480AA0D
LKIFNFFVLADCSNGVYSPKYKIILLVFFIIQGIFHPTHRLTATVITVSIQPQSSSLFTQLPHRMVGKKKIK